MSDSSCMQVHSKLQKKFSPLSMQYSLTWQLVFSFNQSFHLWIDYSISFVEKLGRPSFFGKHLMKVQGIQISWVPIHLPPHDVWVHLLKHLVTLWPSCHFALLSWPVCNMHGFHMKTAVGDILIGIPVVTFFCHSDNSIITDGPSHLCQVSMLGLHMLYWHILSWCWW